MIKNNFSYAKETGNKFLLYEKKKKLCNKFTDEYNKNKVCICEIDRKN